MAVALSGGRDSLTSAILLNKVFHLQGLTVYPSDIIFPRHVSTAIFVRLSPTFPVPTTMMYVAVLRHQDLIIYVT